MNWSDEIKVLEKAIKQDKHEKQKLEGHLRNNSAEDSKYFSELIIKKGLAIQNLQSRLQMAIIKLAEDEEEE
ncbi:MAG: hypothetical protein Q8930_04100 [Bacillota bacterium]|nr:hypothetical protein [Bacillota bacterium]